jgi:hypothetical protein
MSKEQSSMQIKRGHISLFMVAMFAVGGPVIANDKVVTGVGIMSCGKFLEFRASREEMMDMALTSWLQGLLSGMNMQLIVRREPSKALPDPETIMAYVEKHCRDKPLSNPMGGALGLYRELKAAER